MIEVVSIPEQRMRILNSDKKLVKKIEDLGDVKIMLEEGVVIESDDAIKALRVKSVVKAFGRGFGIEDALYLLDDEYELCIIDAKDFAGKSSDRLDDLRGRVIGREGKTKNIIEKLANVKLSIYGKTISIIGKWDCVRCASQAVHMLLEGRKHGSVYRFLEEHIKKI